jgi:hypothetical protein
MICPVDFVPLHYQDTQICVMRDYYSEDGVRAPLTYNEAVAIALDNGWGLPTREMVDEIWRQADCKVSPIPMTPDSMMTHPSRFAGHDLLIDQQVDGMECELIAGHKKDVLNNGHIYGWHRLNGIPIQPETGIHGDNYRDYSHGIRYIIMRD